MTPNWKDYRNPSKDLKFLICTFYVSKLFQTNYLQISDSPFVAGLQVKFFCVFVFWIQ